MRSQVFDDFDAFTESIRDVEIKTLLRNPQYQMWSTSSVDLGRIDVQLGSLGSGNIAPGELRSDGYTIYVPLTNAVEILGERSGLAEELLCDPRTWM